MIIYGLVLFACLVFLANKSFHRSVSDLTEQLVHAEPVTLHNVQKNASNASSCSWRELVVSS